MKTKKIFLKLILFIVVFLAVGCGKETDEKTTTDYMSESAIKNLVLKQASVSEDDVTSYEIKFNHTSDEAIYKVTFRTNDGKYEYEINATTGEIMESSTSKNVDDDDNETEKITGEEKVEVLDGISGISENEAIHTVLSSLGIERSDCVFLTSYVVKYQGHFAYHVKFKTKNHYTMYDYIVNIETGNIVFSEKHG